MEFRNRTVQTPNRVRLEKVSGYSDIYDMYKEEGTVSEDGTKLNQDNLNKGNWRDDDTISFTNLGENDSLPASQEDKTQICAKANGEIWAVPATGLGSSYHFGAIGPQGAQGPKGDKGDAAATIAVGTVNTGAAGSNVTITNSGTSSDVVLNFTIPKGDRGEQGTTGNSALLDKAYPVGSIYMNTSDNRNPADIFDEEDISWTWETFGQGRVLIGNGTSDQSFTAGATGGASNHTLTTAQMPMHNHTVNYGTGSSSSYAPKVLQASVSYYYSTPNVTSGDTGNNQSHNNLQPYIVVYMWRRVS